MPIAVGHKVFNPLSIGSQKQARHQTLRPLITQGLPDVCCTLSIGNTPQPGSEKSSDIRPRMSGNPVTYYYLVGLVYLVGCFYLVALGNNVLAAVLLVFVDANPASSVSSLLLLDNNMI
jgi:hypothetical protein